MAFLGQDDKQKQADQQQAGQQGSNQLQAGGGTVPMTGQGGGNAVTGAPQPQSQPGSGGTGWTNLQSYLTANPNSTTASDTLSKNVGESFKNDVDAAHESAAGVQEKASKAGSANAIAPDQASQMISQMGSNYQYGSQPQRQNYQDMVSQFQNSLNGSYAGPTQYTAQGVSGKSQDYGTALKTQDSTKALLNRFYQNAQGGNLTEGQTALQNLFQVNDPKLESSRQALQTQYQGVDPYIQGQNKVASQAITAAQGAFGTNQNQLRDYLLGQQSQNKGAIDSAVDKFNSTYSDPTGVLSQIQGFADPVIKNYGFAGNPDYWRQSVANLPKSSEFGFAGAKATPENIGGLVKERGQFNALSDILKNGTSPIGIQDQQADPGWADPRGMVKAYDEAFLAPITEANARGSSPNVDPYNQFVSQTKQWFDPGTYRAPEPTPIHVPDHPGPAEGTPSHGNTPDTSSPDNTDKPVINYGQPGDSAIPVAPSQAQPAGDILGVSPAASQVAEGYAGHLGGDYGGAHADAPREIAPTPPPAPAPAAPRDANSIYQVINGQFNGDSYQAMMSGAISPEELDVYSNTQWGGWG